MGYITLADAKAWLNVDDPSEDETILALIEGASAIVDNHCGRKLGRAVETEIARGLGGATLFVRRPPISAVASCTLSGLEVPVIFDSISVTRSDGGLFPLNAAVSLTYTGGYNPLPGDVKHAVRLIMQSMRNSQAMDPNLMGESIAGVFSGSYGESGPGAIPRAARTLLNDYVARFIP